MNRTCVNSSQDWTWQHFWASYSLSLRFTVHVLKWPECSLLLLCFICSFSVCQSGQHGEKWVKYKKQKEVSQQWWVTLDKETFCKDSICLQLQCYKCINRKREPETGKEPKQIIFIIFQFFIFLLVLIIILFFTVFIQQFIIT